MLKWSREMSLRAEWKGLLNVVDTVPISPICLVTEERVNVSTSVLTVYHNGFAA
ncbi:hypothetical protein [Peribacillus sp. Hz7]|uniref:hypothetical protein n=1 Tax=Peribacillus sp. Hz7 TaxID=3344873 RepID=UPI0035CA693B